ncbi:hypothetical protein [Cellulomonas sp. P24]|uniref:hypothetical protein n=1 Tax=Cellulomonas sp. P24 TaxID=2885206 RepID=UPI00216AD5CC|nr:hypothetical protein [Cellulomonas sp. P24]MCR6492833.1 hypothetical protein [Cellulomonas sp. P24]
MIAVKKILTRESLITGAVTLIALTTYRAAAHEFRLWQFLLVALVVSSATALVLRRRVR